VRRRRCVSHPKDHARRAVVDVQGDRGEIIEVVLGIEQEPRRRATKTIDGLRVIADNGQARINSRSPTSTSNCRRFTSGTRRPGCGRRLRRALRPSVILGGYAPVQEQVVEIQQSSERFRATKAVKIEATSSRLSAHHGVVSRMTSASRIPCSPSRIQCGEGRLLRQSSLLLSIPISREPSPSGQRRRRVQHTESFR